MAVASSLTEMFAPDLMSKRIAAWEQHYPWVGAEALATSARACRARARDGEEAMAFVVANATSRALQDACVAALVRKTEILWHLLDCVRRGDRGARRRARVIGRDARAAAGAPRCGCGAIRGSGKHMLLYPERGLELTDDRGATSRGCATGTGRRRRSSTSWPARYAGASRASASSDEVLAFLRSLDERGLLVGRTRRRA